MTTPKPGSPLYRGKAAPRRRPIPPYLLWTAGGGFVLSVPVFRAWGGVALWGLWLGLAVASANFLGLRFLSEKAVSPERGLGLFWVLNLSRWALFLVSGWVLWRISPACLLGGALGYFWALGVLLVFAWREGKIRETS